jgi:hypothetical protein
MNAEQTLEILGYEAFLRRASELDLPFMLKGSYVTRQYFTDPTDRIPQDLDWVYMQPIGSGDEARQLFGAWATLVTERQLGDGVVFRSFQEDAFWRMIDYAMADDFPTVNTDLQFEVAGHGTDFLRVDISFNLPLDVPSEPLIYRPLQGEPFLLSHTTPLALQVAWKLHQTLVRPRFKDLFDLLHLLRHPDFTPAVRQQALDALHKECHADRTNPSRLLLLLAGNLAPLFADAPVTTVWQAWRHNHDSGPLRYYERASTITDASQLPPTLAAFQEQLRAAFQLAGFDAGSEQLSAFSGSPTARKEPSVEKRGFLDSLRNLFN